MSGSTYEIPFRIDLDGENDLAYVYMPGNDREQRGLVKRSIRAADDFVLDLDAEGRLVGIEVLRASSRLAMLRRVSL